MALLKVNDVTKLSLLALFFFCLYFISENCLYLCNSISYHLSTFMSQNGVNAFLDLLFIYLVKIGGCRNSKTTMCHNDLEYSPYMNDPSKLHANSFLVLNSVFESTKCNFFYSNQLNLSKHTSPYTGKTLNQIYVRYKVSKKIDKK